VGPLQHPFQAHDHSTDLAHPAAPAGGCGPGASRSPSPTCGSASVTALPHTGSPAGRHLDWYGALDAIDFPARVAAVHRAIIGASAYLPKALLDATGHELHQIVAGILPGLLMLMAVLAATTVIGAAAGAAIGALAFGVGAAPGAVVGAGLGFEAGIAILDFLGIAFLAVYIGQSLVKATKLAAHAVSLAWQSVDRPEGQRRAVVDTASKTLAAAVAELMRGVLQGIVAFLLAKGTAAVASRVPGLVAKLRSSKLGATFAEWVERNWAELVNNPKLKDAPPASPPVASSPPPAPRATAPKATKAPAVPPPGPVSPTVNPKPEIGSIGTAAESGAYTEIRLGSSGEVYAKLPAPSNPDVLRWQRMNGTGASNRDMYMGGTPSKDSGVGLQVQDRMRGEGTLIGDGENRLVFGADENWHPINKTDMGHIDAAVDYWNNEGRFYGPRSPEVRSFMSNPDNYALEPSSINRSNGASMGRTYLSPATDAEKAQFFSLDGLE